MFRCKYLEWKNKCNSSSDNTMDSAGFCGVIGRYDECPSYIPIGGKDEQREKPNRSGE